VPWGTLALLVFLLAGGAASLWGLFTLRQRFVFESFEVGGAKPSSVERVRPANRKTYPAQFLLLHGYGANRRQLLHLAEVLAAAGGDVYVMDLAGRGDHPGTVSPRTPQKLEPTFPTPVETEAARAVVRHLTRHMGVRAERLVVVGHSLGGGVALDLAREISPAATVSLAGLERVLPAGQPRNLLLITAKLEIPTLRLAADQMYERTQLLGGLAERSEFPATHASLPFHSSVQQAIVDWTNQALPSRGVGIRERAELAIPPLFNESLLGLELGGLLFLAGLFVPLSSVLAWGLRQDPFGEVVPETRFSLWSTVHLAGYALLAGATAVLGISLLQGFDRPVPLSFLRLDGGDYLASVLLLGTVWLLPILARQPWVRSWRETMAKIGASLVLAAYVVVVGGGFITWQLFDMWPTAARFEKMLLLALLLLPYGLGEELLVRSFAKQGGAADPLIALLVWRLGLLVAILGGVSYFATGDILLVLLGIPLLLLSLVEYFFSTTLYQALGSIYGTALLKAILLGWFIAVVFPLR
jgi:dienelactone hydrolase